MAKPLKSLIPISIKRPEYGLLGMKNPHEYTLLGKDHKLSLKIDWMKNQRVKPIDLRFRQREQTLQEKLQGALTRGFPGEKENRFTQSAIGNFVKELAKGKGVPIKTTGTTRINVTTKGKKDELIQITINY